MHCEDTCLRRVLIKQTHQEEELVIIFQERVGGALTTTMITWLFKLWNMPFYSRSIGLPNAAKIGQTSLLNKGLEIFPESQGHIGYDYKDDS